MTTVPRTGTRWMNSCAKVSGVPLVWTHFGPNGPGPGEADFTLLRNPLDTLRSFVKTGAGISETKLILGRSWRAQAQFIAAGGPAFSIHDDALARISKHFGVALVDSGQHYASPNDATIPQELIDWYCEVWVCR